MGKKYVIFSDSTCDLSREERIKYGIWPDVYQQSIIYNDEQIFIKFCWILKPEDNVKETSFPRGVQYVLPPHP